MLRSFAVSGILRSAGLRRRRSVSSAALVQPPRFEQVPDQPAEIRLPGLNGAGVRLWTRVTNPNPFGLRLGTLKGTLFLDDSRAADADFPLGLPLGAGGESVIPIDISISFADLPGLSGVARRILARQPVPYRLEGTDRRRCRPARAAACSDR